MRAAWIFGALVGAGAAITVIAEQADATIENQVVSSKDANVRVGIPRGWRASDQPSYPGVLLWMRKSKPPGLILLTSEFIDDDAYCAWPTACRDVDATLAAKYGCALATSLERTGFHVGAQQAGPRASDDPTLDSIYFDFDDGKKWLRQAIVTDGARAHSLILTAPSQSQRTSQLRAFEQVLRTLHPINSTAASAVPPEVDSPSEVPLDGGLLVQLDAAALHDAGARDAGVPGDAGPTPEQSAAMIHSRLTRRCPTPTVPNK